MSKTDRFILLLCQDNKSDEYPHYILSVSCVLYTFASRHLIHIPSPSQHHIEDNKMGGSSSGYTLMERFTNLGIISFLNLGFIPVLFKLKTWNLSIKPFLYFFPILFSSSISKYYNQWLKFRRQFYLQVALRDL